MTTFKPTITRRHLMTLAGAAAASKLAPAFAEAVAREKMAPEASVLFFKSAKTVSQWDTWTYYHKGAFYLYYLTGPMVEWDGVGLAVSQDGVDWKDHGRIMKKAADAAWLGSGAVWPA